MKTRRLKGKWENEEPDTEEPLPTIKREMDPVPGAGSPEPQPQMLQIKKEEPDPEDHHTPMESSAAPLTDGALHGPVPSLLAASSEPKSEIFQVKVEEDELDPDDDLIPIESSAALLFSWGVENTSRERMARPGNMTDLQLRYFVSFLHREGYDNIPQGTPGIQSIRRGIMQRLQRRLRHRFRLNLRVRVLQRIWSDVKRRHTALVDELRAQVEDEWLRVDPAADGAAPDEAAVPDVAGPPEAPLPPAKAPQLPPEKERVAAASVTAAPVAPAAAPVAPVAAPVAAAQDIATQTEGQNLFFDLLLGLQQEFNHMRQEFQGLKEVVLAWRDNLPPPPPPPCI
ncbi:hypothetical protein XENTR_v10015555 [Xenopus tropicalis]|nr:hypothetical protein XENTR_v10015555 [Xenopus tropicalis]